jgi:diguanylate cyclase (GGDEF)-like protein
VSSETALVIVIAAFVVNLALFAVFLGPTLIARLRRSTSRAAAQVPSPPEPAVDGPLLDGLIGESPTSGPPIYDRVFRIASWAFLIAAALIVALSGLWVERLTQVVVVVALAGGAVLVIHEVVPAQVLGRSRGILLAAAALAFSAGLVFLTGGFSSPFALAFPLIVAGASLVVGRVGAASAAAGAAATYIAAAYASGGAPTTMELAGLAVTLTGLFLLAYIGSAVGREQRRSRDAALRLSAIDALTGQYNRTTFFNALEREIARSDRSGRAFCLVMLDLDDLKTVNDRHGHHAGDAILRAVAGTVSRSVRRIDVAARYGGDEFVALLPETDPTGGWVLAEKIRLGVAELGVAGIESSPTVSVGVVSYPLDGRTADGLMIAADRAMYVSKRGGKNRVARASAEPNVVAIDPDRGRGAGERAV